MLRCIPGRAAEILDTKHRKTAISIAHFLGFEIEPVPELTPAVLEIPELPDVTFQAEDVHVPTLDEDDAPGF
jgi:hypothetical protein